METHLIDCGKEYKPDDYTRPIPFDATTIDSVTETHAHADHEGEIIKLVKAGFNGPIYATGATADITTKVQMPQEINGAYIENKRIAEFNEWARGKKLPNGRYVEFKKFQKILYKYQDVKDIRAMFQKFECTEKYRGTIWDPEKKSPWGPQLGFPYEVPVKVSDKLTETFYEAGHIPGSAQILLEITGTPSLTEYGAAEEVPGSKLTLQIEDNSKKYKILSCFDLGRTDYKNLGADTPLVKYPHTDFPDDIDAVVIEATYGGKKHKPLEQSIQTLEDAIQDTHKRNGRLAIPAFSIMRTHMLWSFLFRFFDEGQLPKDMKFYSASPTADKVAGIIMKHNEDLDLQSKLEFADEFYNPFKFPGLIRQKKAAQTIELLQQKDKLNPYGIIASSGMCEGGRIERILKDILPDPRNMVLLTGYSAPGTRAYRLRRGEKQIPFLRDTIENNAELRVMGGLSGHADIDELTEHIRYVYDPAKKHTRKPLKIFIKHGEKESCAALRDRLIKEGHKPEDVIIMKKAQTYKLAA